MFFDTKNSWPTWLVKISGFLKSVKILGLHCIKIRGLTPVKILGYFSRTRFSNTKTPWPVWLVKISGFIWSRKIWTYILRNSRCKTCQNLGVFIRTRFFDNKSLWPTWLVKILGFLRVQRFWADIVSKSWSISWEQDFRHRKTTITVLFSFFNLLYSSNTPRFWTYIK